MLNSKLGNLNFAIWTTFFTEIKFLNILLDLENKPNFCCSFTNIKRNPVVGGRIEKL